MKTLKPIICLLSLCTIFTSLQASEYRRRQITNADGLTNSSVNMIFQDRSGRVWMGTWDGLNRYDGEHFRSFFPAADNPATLSNNIIREMAELPDGTLWIATDRGVDCFDPGTERFTRYFSDSMGQIPVAENSFHLAAKPDGSLITVVDGHGIFRLRDGAFVREEKLNAKWARFVTSDQKGRLWMLADDGRVLCDNTVQSTGAGFLFFDQRDDQIWIQDAAGYRPLGGRSHSPAVLPPIRSADTDGTFHYLATGRGLYRFSPEDSSITCILPDVPVLSVRCGIQGIIWVGTDMQGVWQLSRPLYDFGTETGIFGGSAVRCFVRGPSGKLAVGTKGSGIFLLSDDGSVSSRITTRNGLLDNAIYSLKDDGELIWIGSDGAGLNYQDKSTGRILVLSAPDSLQIHSVYALEPQGRDTLWVGTSGNGLFALLLDRTAEPVRVTRWVHYTPQQLGSGVIYSLLPSWRGSMFVGTRGAGLQLVRKEDGRLEKMRNDTDDDILSLARGSDGSLWVGTSMGLYRYGQRWDEVTRYSIEDGLPSNTIHGILEDDDACIWVSTNNGLARIRPDKSNIITFHSDDGLQDNEFSDGAFYSSAGVFYFGGIKGFNSFDPLDVGADSFMPNLVLDALYIDNERKVLQDMLREEKGTPTLLLDAGNRSLSFNFTPVDFLTSRRCELAYQLQGYSENWTRLIESHVVAFSNLPAGTYTLLVRCSNSDGEWSPHPFTLRIRKLSPWWQTPLAYWLYAIMGILGLLYAAFRIQRKIQRQIQLDAERAENIKNAAVHEAKLDFFTNIAHEFSNSLTLIYGPCQALRQSARMSGTEQQYLDAIQSNSDRMRNMIQQLISFRKAETGHLSIKIGKVDMVALTAQVVSYFREQMKENQVTFRLDAPPEGVIWTADGDSMEKILFNLLSNAVKYTPAHERITVRLDPGVNILLMDVTNTGVGIPEERQAVIFDRYEVLNRFESALAKGRISNGIGLSLCKSLVELHKGSISINSDGSTYTSFYLELPLLPVQDDHLYQGSTREQFLPESPLSFGQQKEETPGYTSQDTVLVVDDEPEIRTFIRKTLETRFHVEEAGDGEEALAKIAQAIPKVIVSDLKMPRMDGDTLLKTLRADSRTHHIPFILLSGKGTDITPIDALESGADAYLEKPFHPRHLLARVERLLGRDADIIAYSQSARASVEQFSGKEMKKADWELLTRITENILSRLDDESLSGAQVAAAVSISEMQLYRKLKGLIEMTPTEYIRSLRLERAAQMLKTSNKTVQEIMYSCGFVTKTYFFREFARRYGMSPGEYRRTGETT